MENSVYLLHEEKAKPPQTVPFRCAHILESADNILHARWHLGWISGLYLLVQTMSILSDPGADILLCRWWWYTGFLAAGDHATSNGQTKSDEISQRTGERYTPLRAFRHDWWE
jgi:hypothetical protein